MVREIIKDVFFLQQKSVKATEADIAVAQDLLDTLAAHREGCVGLAANMIGESKCIIAVSLGDKEIAMLNPEIVKHAAKSYKTTEGCLSLNGERETERFEMIEVKYRDMNFAKKKAKFSGFTAQIIQHEIDHCQGILI